MLTKNIGYKNFLQKSKVNTIKKDQTDLLNAIAKLREAIDSLNTEGRQRLLAAYSVVNENFQKLYWYFYRLTKYCCYYRF